MISIRSLFFISLVFCFLVTACGRTSAKGLNVMEWVDGNADAPTKNFWAARNLRGIVGQQLTSDQWYENINKDQVVYHTISLGTDQYNQTETLVVGASGDVFYGRQWYAVTGANDQRNSYSYLGTLNADVVAQFAAMNTAVANSTLTELGRGPCPQITSQFAFFTRNWSSANWTMAKLDYTRGSNQCIITAASPSQPMRTFVAWTNYLYKYATQQQ